MEICRVIFVHETDTQWFLEFIACCTNNFYNISKLELMVKSKVFLENEMKRSPQENLKHRL